MKSKGSGKKLDLNKKTIARLNEAHMNEIKGAEDTETTWYPTKTCTAFTCDCTFVKWCGTVNCTDPC